MALKTGDRFPELTVQTVDGRPLTIPQDVAGANKVILVYRGGW
jgi:hypothetical protein